MQTESQWRGWFKKKNLVRQRAGAGEASLSVFRTVCSQCMYCCSSEDSAGMWLHPAPSHRGLWWAAILVKPMLVCTWGFTTAPFPSLVQRMFLPKRPNKSQLTTSAAARMLARKPASSTRNRPCSKACSGPAAAGGCRHDAGRATASHTSGLQRLCSRPDAGPRRAQLTAVACQNPTPSDAVMTGAMETEGEGGEEEHRVTLT